MVEMKSTVPGLAGAPGRESFLKTPYGFLAGRRKLDGAEGLWRIGNKLYDLKTFAKNHPGGAEWIQLTQDTDITEVFEAHHITDKASKLLPKYFVREVFTPRSVGHTFEPDGFFRSFRKRALAALKDVDFHRPAAKSNLIADFVVSSTFLLALAAVTFHSYFAVLLAGIFLAWTTIIAHNYFHMRDNFRMFYFDLSLMSSKDWRISHVMSHHTYPNTLWDFEIYTAEPMLKWYPNKNKTLLSSILSQLMSPLFWAFVFFEQSVKRYYSVFFEYRTFQFRDAVPFILPLTMACFAPSVSTAVNTWLLIVMTASFVFGAVGFNAAHHHPDIFHDGDICRDDIDWGLMELDAVRDRKVIDDSDFLVLTNFGMHGIHHLLPTVDHTYLPLCRDAFNQTCKEFGVNNDKWTQWKLMKGQFQQLSRTEPKKNYR